MRLKNSVKKLERIICPSHEIIIVAYNIAEAENIINGHIKKNPHARFIIVLPKKIDKPQGCGE